MFQVIKKTVFKAAKASDVLNIIIEKSKRGEVFKQGSQAREYRITAAKGLPPERHLEYGLTLGVVFPIPLRHCESVIICKQGCLPFFLHQNFSNSFADTVKTMPVALISATAFSTEPAGSPTPRTASSTIIVSNPIFFESIALKKTQ